MKITFLGAAETVTGSNYLCDTGKVKFLVDCGMFQGGHLERDMNEEPFGFNAPDIDFMILTHAHIDHSGRIPKLYKEGFRGIIYTTKPTAELCAIMLPDSAHIQESEAEWENRKRMRADVKPVEPLYTIQDANESLKLFKPAFYGDMIKITDEISVRFNDAGHILGSSVTEVFVKESDGKVYKTVFSGDLGNRRSVMLRDPAIIEETDNLIMESTYGDRNHESKGDMFERFINIVSKTIERGGNVVIPSFAVGRTQEMILELNKDKDNIHGRKSQLRDVPVYVDSPLATLATDVFKRNQDCLAKEAAEYIKSGDNPLDFSKLIYTHSVEESKAINEDPTPKIIISASGMCEAGRIKHHLKHNLWRPECTILFVGYQAEGTLGRRLIEGAKTVKLFGEEVSVKAEIEVIEGFSGHADMDGLLEWLGGFKSIKGTIFLTHGEPDVMAKFAQAIEAKTGISPMVAKKQQTYDIDGATAQIKKEDRGQAEYFAEVAAMKERISTIAKQLNDKLDLRDMGVSSKSDLAGLVSNIELLLAASRKR